MSDADHAQIKAFIDTWTENANQTKKAFVYLVTHLEKKQDIRFEFIARDGLTHSLRTSRAGQKDKPLFAMIDVIEEDPRWLSVCFYAELISDPDARGDMIPGGLLGEDGYCFDIDAFDDADMNYLCARLDEAYNNVNDDIAAPE